MNAQRFGKVVTYLVTVAFMLISCTSGANGTPEITATPSITPSPTDTSTPTITPTLTPTITPTLALPVNLKTSVPFSNTQINAENINNLREIARYYGEVNYIAKLTNDKKYLFILDGGGIVKYDYKTMKPLADVSIGNSPEDLQVSNDGKWILINNFWLLDLRNDNEPKLRVLSQEIELKYYPTFSLSPDGSTLAISEYKCYDACTFRFQIINTTDSSVLYAWNGLDSQGLYGFHPTFSSDGLFIATENPLFEVDRFGNGKRIRSSVNIWNISELKKVASIKIDFPYYVTDIAFSEEPRLLAVAKQSSIEIFDGSNGSIITSITGLCSTYGRTIKFVPSNPQRLLESSDCQSGIWTINSGVATFTQGNIDFSKTTFDNKGNPEIIPYPHQTTNWNNYRKEFDFQFLGNDLLLWQSCYLSLGDGSITCSNDTKTLGTDEQFYKYIIDNNTVNFYSLATGGNAVYYSLPWRGYNFHLNALDPVNKLITYTIAIDPNKNRIVIQDMESGSKIMNIEGQTYLQPIVFSGDKKFAALCRVRGYSNSPDKDDLLIFNLVERKVVFSINFTCGNVAMAMSHDGSKFAAEYYYLRDPKDKRYSTKVLLLNTNPPYDRKYFEVEGNNHAISFSPDDSLLAFACQDNKICFLDPSDGKEIFKLSSNTGIANLAFTKDMRLLATLSNWGLISLWAIPPFKPGQVQPTSTPTITPTVVPTVDIKRAAFFTGWENGQPEGFGDLVLDSQNVAGYFNSSEPPPEASPRSLENWATTKMAPNGGTSYLMVAGYSQAPDSYIYFKLFDTNIKIENGMKLRYWIYTHEGKTFAIDGKFTDGTTIRDFNNNGYLTDQNGNRIHPAFQDLYDTGYWRYVEVDLSNAAGKVLDYLMVGFDNGDNGLIGSIRAYVDNLSISQ